MVHSLALDAGGLRAAFPFYLAFSRDLQVVDVGPSLAKIAPALVPGEGLLAHLSVVQPELESLDFTALTQHPGAVFVLELGDSGTMLSGPILLASQPSVGLFLGSPSLAGVSLVDRESLSRGGDEHADGNGTLDATCDLPQRPLPQEAALVDNRRLIKELSQQHKTLRETNAALERVNQTLVSAESTYRTVVENLHEVVFQSNQNGDLVLLNPAWEQLTGVSVEQSLGRTWSSFINKHAWAQISTTLSPLLRLKTREANFEVPIIDAKGALHYCEVSVHTLISDNVFMGMSGTMRDITQRRLAQLEMMARDDLMASAAEAMRQLLVSHGPNSYADALKVMGNALAADRVSIFLERPSVEQPFASWTKPGFAAPALIKLPPRWRDAFTRGERVEGRVNNLPPAEQAQLQEQGVHALLAVPVIREGHLLGYIRFDDCKPGQFFQGSENSILQLFCSGVAGRVARNEVENELLSSELRKAMVLESSLDCVITLDANRTIVDYNPASERTFGYSQSEAIGRDIAVLLLPPAYREAHQEGLKQASITGLGSILGRRIEIPALRADGREIDIELSVVRGEVSGQRMYTAYLRDITEAKRVDARLHLLESVSVNARDPVLIVGSSTSETQPVVLYVNEAFTQLTGYTKTESVGQPLCFLGSEPANQTNTPLVSALTSTEPVTVELQLLHKHGSPTWVELRATPVHNDDGSIAHHIGLMRDVSQQKQTTAAMRRARDLAEAANRTKSQFLANMSHEFRTPLNAVIGFSQILARGMFGSLNEHQSRSVNNILVSGQHLLQLINDILNLSEMDSGRIILDRKRIDVPVAIAEAAGTLVTLINKKQLTLATEFTDNLPQVLLDEAKFKQIIVNLLSNAIKFTPQGGKIIVSACSIEPSKTDFGQLQVCVQDNGIGIKPEDQARVFNEFEQVDSSYTREQEGTGLGLTLISKLTRLHGGFVDLESSGVPGEGTCFRLNFPVETPALPAEAAARTAILVSEGPNGRLRTALEHAGFFVLCPQTPERGLQAIVNDPPSVVLLSPQRRSLGTLRFVESLRALPNAAATPVVLFDASALSDEERNLVGKKVQATTPVYSGEEIIALLHSLGLTTSEGAP